jgi:hypothetical protein
VGQLLTHGDDARSGGGREADETGADRHTLCRELHDRASLGHLARKATPAFGENHQRDVE